ncbi:DUF6284 family protein [Streptomyces sp. TP-A0874]|uniref:DUF6284 family protein n=1 Tax=Streptomyces sp. TP-A0874 TaxID=549819 RepID=UPI00085371F6|nr:DUF6284 family protein [Streptomyces sp. TP-A0874]
MKYIVTVQDAVTAGTDFMEPTAAELDAIEAEMPVIRAEVELLDAQITALDRALDALGFTLADGARWRWEEWSEDSGDPDSAVVLFATSTVEEVAA